jgi:DNA-binding IclR family transcriptional regulator
MLMQREQPAFRSAAGPLRSYTPATVIDATELGRQLTAARARGWAQEIEELRPGVASIAAPIFAGPHCGFAAMGIEGPTERVCREGAPRRDLIGAVIQAAGVVARELASVPWLR